MHVVIKVKNEVEFVYCSFVGRKDEMVLEKIQIVIICLAASFIIFSKIGGFTISNLNFKIEEEK